MKVSRAVGLGLFLFAYGCGGAGSAQPPPLPPEPKAQAGAEAEVFGNYRHVGGQADVEARDAAIDVAARELPSFAQDKARAKLKVRAAIAETLSLQKNGEELTTQVGDLTLTAPSDGDPVDFTPPRPDGEEAKTVQLSHAMVGAKLVQTVQGERGGVRRVYVPGAGGKLTVEVTIYSERLPESVVFDLHYARDADE